MSFNGSAYNNHTGLHSVLGNNLFTPNSIGTPAHSNELSSNLHNYHNGSARSQRLSSHAYRLGTIGRDDEMPDQLDIALSGMSFYTPPRKQNRG